MLSKCFGGILSFILFVVAVPQGRTASFFVDSSRVSNGDGSEGNPWKGLNNINWTTVGNALSQAPTDIYLSSRDNFPNIGDIPIPISGTASKRLRIIGDEKFNPVNSGTASWQPETSRDNRALTTSNGSGWVFPNNSAYVTLQGICITNSSYGGINLGVSNPTTGIHDIIVTNCNVISPLNNHGIWFGYAEAGCHSITISHCLVTNTSLEGIYIGHYNYFGTGKEITNVVVEFNTVVDTGLGGEGDIDIKPGVTGAIVRYNKHYRSAVLGGSNCGTVVAANNCQIYGNEFFSARQRVSGDIDWGYGIYLNAEGDGVSIGQAITSCRIYNNVIYSNDWSGIKILATRAGISGVKLWNNTVWGNRVNGIFISGQSGQGVTIDDMKNNIVGANGSFDIELAGNVTLTSCDYNLYYRPSGNSWAISGVGNSFVAWKSNGYDAHGINEDPLLDSHLGLATGGPALLAGTDLSSNFTVDKNRQVRSTWGMGAFRLAGGSPPAPPARLRVAP